MKIRLLLTVFVCYLLLMTNALADDTKPLTTVSSVDLNRYVGKWYEIARYPNRFQKKCAGNVTANYKIKENGNIEVVNACQKESGEMMTATGKAKIVDKTTNAKLKVSFFWIFYGAYWIIDLDPDYKYAVVSEPGRNYLWILSRTPQIDDETYKKIVKGIEEKGLDTSKIVKTKQDLPSK